MSFGQPPGGGGGFGQPPGGGFGQPPPAGGGFGPPPGGAPPGVTPPPTGAGPGSSDAAQLVKLPSMLMIGFGAVSVLSSMMVTVGSLWSFAVNGDGGQLVAGLWSVVMIGVNALVAFAGFKMGKLQTYPLAVAAAAFCCLPFCTGYCCVIGLVPGIWSIVVLMKPEVKAAFS